MPFMFDPSRVWTGRTSCMYARLLRNSQLPATNLAQTIFCIRRNGKAYHWCSVVSVDLPILLLAVSGRLNKCDFSHFTNPRLLEGVCMQGKINVLASCVPAVHSIADPPPILLRPPLFSRTKLYFISMILLSSDPWYLPRQPRLDRQACTIFFLFLGMTAGGFLKPEISLVST